MNHHEDNPVHPSDDLAAYALGALEPDEEATVRDHLDGCERCRSELQWLRPAVDVLPASVPQVEPPRRLKRDLMKTVREDARAERGGWWSRRAGWISMRARPALAVAAVALLVAGIAGYAVNEANEDGGSAAETITLAGDASGVVERDGDEATLRVSGMQRLDDGDVYQLWYGDSDGVEPAKAFTVGEDGSAETDLGEIPPGTEELMVTEESEPGLPRPQGEVLLSATLS
jgi:anti-sigma factor RsiW